MKREPCLDLEKLKARAFHIAEWAEEVIRRYHSAKGDWKEKEALQLEKLYGWIFVPVSLWPFNIQEVLTDCLDALEKRSGLSARLCLLIELLPQAPDENVCEAVAGHELNVEKGVYENLVHADAKFSQTELAMRSDPQLHSQWSKIKAAFKVATFQDHKGVIRRTMGTERNLRPFFSVNISRRADANCIG